jgi:fatty-acyl-CoA synthase
MRSMPEHATGTTPASRTIAQHLAARADDDHPGLVTHEASWTWRQAVADGAARGALARSLLRPGPPHVGVLLPNVAEYMLWLYGAALAGATVVGINPTRRGEALAADIRATDCQLIVTDDDGAALLEGLDLGVGADRVLHIGSEDYRSLVADHRGAAADALVADADAVAPEQLYLLLFTSGTTGTPKAVRCTQGRLGAIAGVTRENYAYRRESICYCPMPLFHGNALMALWAPALSLGATMALRPRFSASAFLDDVRRFGATNFSYVGKAIAYILATPGRGCGSAARAHDRERFGKRFGCTLVEGYGQSEGGVACTPVPGTPRGSLGKPVAGVDLAVVDPETGEECPPARFDATGRLLNAAEATGEIVNRSGQGGFEGYYGAPEADHERTRNGWYWTGDLGYRDAEGFLYFAGRRGDWLRVDSENFAAGPIESLLSRHPDVAVVAVYGVPDTRSGDQVMAAVELVPGARFDPAGFAEWLEAQPDLGTKWTPRYVRVCPSLPQVANGKVTKVALRSEAWDCDDPVYWRPDRGGGPYRRLTDEDRRALAEEMAIHRR